MTNPGSWPAGPPRSGGTPWGKIIGFSCGGCALLLVGGIAFLASLGAQFGRHNFAIGKGNVSMNLQVPHVPLLASQQGYVGNWQGADGTTLVIRADGSGEFRQVKGNSNVNVRGVQVKIMEPARTLSLLIRTWHIDQPPHRAGDRTEITLDGIRFERTGDPEVEGRS